MICLLSLRETEIANLREENQRLRNENRDLKEANKNLRDINEQLMRDIERYKLEIETLRKQFELLLEEKKRDNEDRKNRKSEKQKYIELLKKSMMHKMMPDQVPQPLLSEEEPVQMFAGRKGKVEAVQKPKIKAFVEFEKQKTAYYTHYIAHPCPYCMPTHGGCPMHGGHHPVVSQLSDAELNSAKLMLQSGNAEEQARGLKTLFIHGQADPRAKQFIDEKYPGMDVESIIRGQDYNEFAMQLGGLLSTYQKSGASGMGGGSMYSSHISEAHAIDHSEHH